MAKDKDLWLIGGISGMRAFKTKELPRSDDYGAMDFELGTYSINLTRISEAHFDCDDCTIIEFSQTVCHELIHACIGKIFKKIRWTEYAEERIVRIMTGEIMNEATKMLYKRGT